MALYLKRYAVSSAIHDYSVNKLHLLTGLSAGVVKKRVATLVVYGLAEYAGKKKDVLVLRTPKSGTKHRNVFINDDDFKCNDKLCKNGKAQEVKHIDDLVCIAMIVEIQRHKDYAKHIIQQKENPESVKDFKAARSACKNAGYGNRYVENGISYCGMAKSLGVGVQKTFSLVQKACKLKILRKINNIRKVFYKGALYVSDLFKSYTYIYNDMVYKVYANTYQVL